jgi:NADH-quinone oxidoreductase subunit G
MHLAKNVPLGDLIYLDEERCIQCARCIRFQDEVAGDPVLSFDDRGRAMRIITVSEPGFDSVFSGNTTDICPVGALTTADFRFGARPWELTPTASICGQCPVGCNTTLNTRREAGSNGRIVIKRVMPRQNESVNEIWMCDKGRFAHQYIESPERLTKPLVRREGKLTRASWDAATLAAGDAFARARKNLLVLASGRLSNEDLFNLKALADQAGGRAMLYSNMGGGQLTAQVGMGDGSNLGSLRAGSTIVVVASDLYEEAPVWYLRIKQAAERGATLIVANPRETKLDRYATYVVRYAYGDEVKTLQSATRRGKVGEAFMQAENAVILFGSEGLGLGGSAALATACARALHETGHTGKPNNGLIGVWEYANHQGAAEIGLEPAENIQAAFDRASAVYIVGADPIGDGAITPKGGRRRPFLLVQDLFETATAQAADVVLPAQTYMERDGTFTSGERRVQRFYAAVPAPEGTKPDFAITAQVARASGVILEGSSASVVFDIMAAEEDSPFARLSYARLAEVQEQWPIVGRGDMYYGGTTYENTQGLGVQLFNAGQRGKKVWMPRLHKAAALRPRERQLLGVPVTRLYDRTRSVSSAQVLESRIGEAFVALHPSAAESRGIAAGERVTVSLDGTSEQVLVKFDPSISTGVALIPRSMGLPIMEPTPIRIKSGRKGAAR